MGEPSIARPIRSGGRLTRGLALCAALGGLILSTAGTAAAADVPPNTPTSLSTSPDSVNPNGAACGTGQPGWIGRTIPLSDGTSDISLRAWGSTPAGGTNITVGFHLWDTMTNDGNGAPKAVSSPQSQQINGLGWGTAYIGTQVRDGHRYDWNAWAYDGLLSSPETARCSFSVDLSAPSLAQFGVSADFPPLGSGIKPTKHAGEAGSVTVTSTDPTPVGCELNACVKSGIRGFQYSLDSNIPTIGAKTVWVTPDANGTATAEIPISLTADQAGTHRLYVNAVDGAGNSQPGSATYDFYAPAPVVPSYSINSAYNPSRCLDNWGAPTGGDGALHLYDCWNGTSQKFTFPSDGTLRTGGHCISTRDNATANGTTIAIVACSGATGQAWTLRADGSLYNPTANACLELPGWHDGNGTVLGIWSCHGGANQRWNLTNNTA